jgi:hypothetical protein
MGMIPKASLSLGSLLMRIMEQVIKDTGKWGRRINRSKMYTEINDKEGVGRKSEKEILQKWG